MFISLCNKYSKHIWIGNAMEEQYQFGFIVKEISDITGQSELSRDEMR